jgi:NhaA family Na+:H+ antiporter
MRKSSLDLLLVLPIKNFIEKKTSVGILLIFSAVLAMIIANSFLAEQYHSFFKQYVYVGFNDFVIKKNILHWINDGLMSMFFFLVGLELKREIMQGELASVRAAILPIAAAIGGMIFPALIYWLFTQGTTAVSGWGIPMATDIAFALGILYLLGDRVPMSLKVFLTAVAIVDDLGAVLVIAFFYTSEISMESLALGGFVLFILMIGNFLGIRNTLFYTIIGIGGLWLAILLSGVHATIAAVLAAFTIPMTKRINTPLFLRKARIFINRIKQQNLLRSKKIGDAEDKMNITMEKISMLTEEATPPLQRLEHALHPFVSFVVLPIFAFANAGVTIDSNSFSYLSSPITLGVILGLLLGKVLGITLMTKLMVVLKLCTLPNGIQWKHVLGLAFLAAIGFTMSLFITELAFENEIQRVQAKIGILTVSLIAGIMGYFFLKLIDYRKVLFTKK